MTAMRDATNKGPGLWVAHHKAGCYLANKAPTDEVGIEQFLVLHVDDYQAVGY